MDLLRDELSSRQLNTWTRSLQVEAEGDELRVYAPDRFVLDWVNEKYLGRLLELLGERGGGQLPALSLLIGSKRSRTPRATITLSQTHVTPPPPVVPPPTPVQPASAVPVVVPREELPLAMTVPSVSSDPYEPEEPSINPLAVAMPVRAAPAVCIECNVQVEGAPERISYLNRTFTFRNSVEGKSNQLARAAA